MKRINTEYVLRMFQCFIKLAACILLKTNPDQQDSQASQALERHEYFFEKTGHYVKQDVATCIFVGLLPGENAPDFAHFIE
ncbi:hypothetical protein [Spirosoma sp. KNUC1025]|uniref:hypothetical protein n=1 Tax=Spirosoma sp. KNUC1025 TaxID=2894082 RepID=UPI00386D48B4|nr:hypothetical protein LN737_22085 [Spirosoma sp. KNUC1025]